MSMFYRVAGMLIFAAAFANQLHAEPAASETPLAPWQAGYLDIHHIQTGRGNATFAILPDGTTLLIDAGALADDWASDYEPLRLAPAVPDNSRRPGEWIADYIEQFAPSMMTAIDYAVVTHFHSDHYGEVQPSSPSSRNGQWRLAGLADVADKWPLRTLLDRGFPDYSFPVNLRATADDSLLNYINFVVGNVEIGRMQAMRFAAGRNDQIVCKINPEHCPGFSVRNIAVNGVVWSGTGSATTTVLDPAEIVNADGKFNENPLSAVIKIDYGDFDYVTGGDLTGLNEPDQPEWFAMEGKIAPIIGEVDAMTLNHHGNRDATSAAWLRALTPRVLVQQTWVSDQPGGEVVARVASRNIWAGDRDIFATYVHPEAQIAIGPRLARSYTSLQGHVVIRVEPGGTDYRVYVLDDKSPLRSIVSVHGPYESR